MKYVCYYRVSTKSQGRSGLGLGDQVAIVKRYAQEGDQLIAKFTEIESRKKSNRPNFVKQYKPQKNQANLLIAKWDRLSRNVAFVMTVRDSGVNFVSYDYPMPIPSQSE